MVDLFRRKLLKTGAAATAIAAAKHAFAHSLAAPVPLGDDSVRDANYEISQHRECTGQVHADQRI